MSIIYRVLIAVGLASVLSACSFKPLNIAVDPELEMPAGNIGQGQEIAVSVVDRRDNARLGYREISGKKADILAETPLLSVVESRLIEGLARRGFKPTGKTGEGLPEYELQIVKTAYNTEAGGVKATMTLDTELRAVARYEGGVTENDYRAQREENMAFAPMAEDNKAFIDKALGSVLHSALDDDELLGKLVD
ncbi:MAG: YajG family lipoprotein [Pseudomonadota bacterium]